MTHSGKEPDLTPKREPGYYWIQFNSDYNKDYPHLFQYHQPRIAFYGTGSPIHYCWWGDERYAGDDGAYNEDEIFVISERLIPPTMIMTKQTTTDIYYSEDGEVVMVSEQVETKQTSPFSIPANIINGFDPSKY